MRDNCTLGTFGFGFSSCASRVVRSFVSCASSCGLFCLLRPRPKKEAMLSGNAAMRRFAAGAGDNVRGCGLLAGPERSYLDGANMRFMGVDDVAAR
jgi:hypothetical protein